MIRIHTLPLALFCCAIFLSVATNSLAQDPNFHIYLSFGQSNMEGQGTIEAQDREVDPRFQVLQAVDCGNLRRQKDNWYPAVPPLTRCYSGLSPADYFGRTMVENLPDSIRVGIINVSVAGSKIELFDKETYEAYISSVTEGWLLNIINEYNGNPYEYLINLGKLAQNEGVIKGFLLHQGESNSGDNQWPSKVKKIYDDLIEDLDLPADSIPLLAGEVVHADQGGIVAGMNRIIGTLPQTLPNSYVISSSGCQDAADNLHFNSAGYRELGKRYAIKMLSLLGYEAQVNEEDSPVNTFSAFYEPECAVIGDNWNVLSDPAASNETFVTAKAGMEHIEGAPTDGASMIDISFSVDTTGSFKLLARLNNPTYDDDSFWLKMDEEEFTAANGFVTDGWEWVNIGGYELAKGTHTLTIAFREDGAKLDKIGISNFDSLPEGFGDEALNICNASANENSDDLPVELELFQNYPNPFNPSTTITYGIPSAADVTLEVFTLSGQKVVTLINSENKPAGLHSVHFKAEGIASGMYIYRLKAGTTIITKTLTLIK